jgi:alpha-L-fucosidase 2
MEVMVYGARREMGGSPARRQRPYRGHGVWKSAHGMSYQPVGDLNILFPGHENPSSYYRELDLSKAVTTTRYTVDGVEFVREIFASFPDQVIIAKITASQKEKINFSAWFTSLQKSQTSVEADCLILKGVSGDERSSTVLP